MPWIKAIGFTGTARGMTQKQEAVAYHYLNGIVHHGDCIGADAEAHDIALEISGIDPVIHPPINPKFRAFKSSSNIKEPKQYLKRNRDIVDETVELVATPAGFEEELRSGTWMTIRYARAKGKRITIIWPDGHVTIELEK